MTEQEALEKWASERGISAEIDAANWWLVETARQDAQQGPFKKSKVQADLQAADPA